MRLWGGSIQIIRADGGTMGLDWAGFRGCGLVVARASKAQRTGKRSGCCGRKEMKWYYGKGEMLASPLLRYHRRSRGRLEGPQWVQPPAGEAFVREEDGDVEEACVSGVSQRAGQLRTWQFGNLGKGILMSTWSFRNRILSEMFNPHT